MNLVIKGQDFVLAYYFCLFPGEPMHALADITAIIKLRNFEAKEQSKKCRKCHILVQEGASAA